MKTNYCSNRNVYYACHYHAVWCPKYRRQEFPVLKRRLPTLWTNSYFVSPTGGAPLELVKQYIEEQKGR
ncbi:MAG TPA: transposase [Ktedonobacteraceae bacterium]